MVPIWLPCGMLSTPGALSRALDPDPPPLPGMRRLEEACEEAVVRLGLPRRRDAEAGDTGGEADHWDGGRAAGDESE